MLWCFAASAMHLSSFTAGKANRHYASYTPFADQTPKRPNRMSKKNHRQRLNLVTLLLHVHAAAATSNLRNEIDAVVPACAQQCVLSFLSVNFDADKMDGMGVTLDSICAADSRSGFTLGEGAMQCLTAEKSVGSCSDSEASGTCIDSKACYLTLGGTFVANLSLCALQRR